MRFKLMLCGVTLIPAALLAGCGMDQSTSITPNVDSPAITGQAFGGQAPVVGSTISVMAMGTSGYGSNGTVLASTTTDSNGSFSFAPGAYSCPQSNTPVYLVGIGGNSGYGNNGASVEAAALGTCSNAKQSFVVMNEVTTVATAFVLSHFFSTTFGGSNAANDWFGGPSSGSTPNVVYSKGLVMGSTVTIPAIVNNASGTVNPNSATVTIEAAKINTIANILAACINSSGSTKSGQPCATLFKYTTTPGGQVPTDTLQATVSMALNPALTAAKMDDLYVLSTAQAPFNPYLSAAPNDWSIGVSYTSTAVGLTVQTGTTSTLDIDSTGRIWFPSNASGKVGAAYFDPTTTTFYGPFNTTGLVDPQQVAIDANGYAWYNDNANAAISGYMVTAPATTESVSLPNTLSTSLSVGGDDRLDVGITNGSLYELAAVAPNRSSYSLVPGITFLYPVTSVAADMSGNTWVAATDSTTTEIRNYYVSSTPAETDIVNANADAGQALFTGNDFATVRSYTGTGTTDDGLCLYSTSKCYNFVGGLKNSAQGIAIDGGGQLWVAESGYAGTTAQGTANAGVIEVQVNNPGATDGAIYLNSSGAANIPINQLVHGASTGTDGGTATATAPYGVGVDAVGNVWLSNVGCNVAYCAPGSFTLTEIVGAGYPTITPVSAQITSGTNLVGTEPKN